MSIATDTAEAELSIMLRQQIAAEKQAHRALVEANDALRRENDRLKRLVRLLDTATQGHALKVQTMIREV